MKRSASAAPSANACKRQPRPQRNSARAALASRGDRTLVCILAGGLSSRMGRDKARLRLGRRSLLGWVRTAARATGWPVRVIRRDLVPRCGPLGGVATALRCHAAGMFLFLSCDTPFLSATLLRKVVQHARRTRRAVFTGTSSRPGFPFALHREHRALVERQIAQGEFSVKRLAHATGAAVLRLSSRAAGQLFNVNTPADWQEARRRWRPSRVSNC